MESPLDAAQTLRGVKTAFSLAAHRVSAKLVPECLGDWYGIDGPSEDSTEIPFEYALALEKAEKRDEKAIRHAGD